ncbi:hypothetical protein BDB00DRAFT_786536 [Zychaea mexicana]|uniref:uncharacterized protein n=1 Tax=Zychaea mexicana TaxID=64656 RepID=UPI0022FE4D14|nr:uncharacterized protein BDB00DRAFT_786536 [Zychaea mexicana]KAI9495190.1 hypothetical protein BDB00DRAFT_786536 [Zychaea mexicana]
MDPAPGSGGESSDDDDDVPVTKATKDDDLSVPQKEHDKTSSEHNMSIGYHMNHLNSGFQDEEIRICTEGIAEIQSALARFAQEDMEIPEEERSIAMLARAARMLDSGESDDDEEQQSPAEHGEAQVSSVDIGNNGYERYIPINKVLRDKGKNPLWNIFKNLI